MAFTLSELRTLVRQRADMENSTFVSASIELTYIINDSIKECMDVVFATLGHEHFVLGLDAVYPADAEALAIIFARRIIRVDTVIDSVRRPMRRLNRYDEAIPTESQEWTADTDLAYALGLDTDGATLLSVHPAPDASTTIRLWFVPALVAITTATEPIPDYLDTWAEYIIIDAAIKCKEKEESDTTALERAKANMLSRIATYAAPLDNNPLTIADARSRDEDDELGVDAWWY